MLEGLDRIDWSALRGFYGRADNVPEQLRAFASTNREGRREIYEAFQITHQGSVCEATAPAVPFLFEMARAPEVADRDEVVETLSIIAAARPPPASSFGVPRINPFTRQPMPGSERWAEDLAKVVAATRSALVAYCADALALLEDADAAVRAQAALLLSWLVECRDGALPAVRAAALREPGPRTAYLLALTRLEDREPSLASTIFAAPASESERVAAAFFLAQALGANAPPTVRTALESAGLTARFDDVLIEGGRWNPPEFLARLRAE